MATCRRRTVEKGSDEKRKDSAKRSIAFLRRHFSTFRSEVSFSFLHSTREHAFTMFSRPPIFSAYSNGSCESPFSPLPSFLGTKSYLPPKPASYHPLDGTAYPFPLMTSRPSSHHPSVSRTNSDELPSSSWSSSSSSNGERFPSLQNYSSALPMFGSPPSSLLFEAGSPADVAHNRTKHGGCTPGAPPPMEFVRCCDVEGRREGKERAKNHDEVEQEKRKDKTEVIEKWREASTGRAMTLPVLKRRSNPLAGGMWMSRMEKDGSMEASERGEAQDA